MPEPDKPEPEPEYLTVEEVAGKLRVSIETVRRMLRSGRLKGRLLSRQMGYRVPRSEVARLMEAPNEQLETIERRARRIASVEDRLNALNTAPAVRASGG